MILKKLLRRITTTFDLHVRRWRWQSKWHPPPPPYYKKKILKKIHLLSQLTTMFDFLVVGEGGKAVVIDKDKLSPEEKKKFDDGWQKNAFNQYASDMISLHRSLPDVRDPE